MLMKSVCESVKLRAHDEFEPAERDIDDPADENGYCKGLENIAFVKIDPAKKVRDPHLIVV